MFAVRSVPSLLSLKCILILLIPLLCVFVLVLLEMGTLLIPEDRDLICMSRT